VIYVVRGTRGCVGESGSSPSPPHQEINASPDEPLACVVIRSGQDPVVVNLDPPDVESNPEEVHWTDDIHGPPENR
jgi:uncharacterized RmlC-like cupin family protein